MHDRSRRQRYGYIEPEEAADEMIAEVLQPHLDRLKKCQALGLSMEATKLCMGLLLGLYRYSTESVTEIIDWVPDAPEEYAEEVIDTWKQGSPGEADLAAVRDFLQEEEIDWKLGLT